MGRWRVLPVVDALTATTGCGDGGPVPGTALDLRHDEHRICVPAPAAPAVGVTFGDTVVRHAAPGPVTITEVALVDASGAVVHPDEHWNLVLVVGAPQEGPTGSAAATGVTYRDHDGRLSWQDTVTAMRVTRGTCADVLAGTPG